METIWRSTTKALLWQGIGLVSMGGVGWLVTGSFTTGSALALANSVTGLALYLVYERVWARISWGRHWKPDEDRRINGQ